MFPNSQSALPLPLRPSLERNRKLAKELVKACRSAQEPGPPDGDWAEIWAEAWIEGLVDLSGIPLSPESPVRVASWVDGVAAFARRQMHGGRRNCALADAQFVLARSHGFAGWATFTGHLDALKSAGSLGARFEAAADAIVGGDRAALKQLLEADSGLIRARSGREHGATLLHYVGANGVEGYRQKSPENAAEIAEQLLSAGAQVDATAHVYGADCTTLELAATSGHPEWAGVQEALLGLLLDHGAALDTSVVKACLGNGRVKAAEFLAERLHAEGAMVGLVASCGLGRLDWVARYFSEDGSLTPRATVAELCEGFRFACQFGREATAEFLLDHGVDIQSADAHGQTGLHHAVIGGRPGVVRLLLRYHPPLEAVNAFGGTPLGQALWSAAHGGNLRTYLEILEELVAAGAKLPERHVPVNATIDSWLWQHGSHAEPEWHWFGEGRENRASSSL